jgi:hypothetical protein
MSVNTPNIIGKIYTWANGTLRFDSENEVTTTWGKGTYKWLSETSLEVSWLGYFHLLKMDSTYNSYTSIRKGDLITQSGSLIIFTIPDI